MYYTSPGSAKGFLYYDGEERATPNGDKRSHLEFGYDFNITIPGLYPQVILRDTGVTAGYYSAVTVDAKGRVTAGGKSIEFGTSEQTAPSDDLMVGGLFFELQ